MCIADASPQSSPGADVAAGFKTLLVGGDAAGPPKSDDIMSPKGFAA